MIFCSMFIWFFHWWACWLLTVFGDLQIKPLWAFLYRYFGVHFSWRDPEGWEHYHREDACVTWFWSGFPLTKWYQWSQLSFSYGPDLAGYVQETKDRPGPQRVCSPVRATDMHMGPFKWQCGTPCCLSAKEKWMNQVVPGAMCLGSRGWSIKEGFMQEVGCELTWKRVWVGKGEGRTCWTGGSEENMGAGLGQVQPGDREKTS